MVRAPAGYAAASCCDILSGRGSHQKRHHHAEFVEQTSSSSQHELVRQNSAVSVAGQAGHSQGVGIFTAEIDSAWVRRNGGWLAVGNELI